MRYKARRAPYPPMNDQDRYSLRRRLLVRLWLPLFIVLILEATIAFVTARYFGNAVHDRWLYDSAMTLAAQIKPNAGKVELNLAPAALEMFEWDSVDRIFEEVSSRKMGRIFGNA